MLRKLISSHMMTTIVFLGLLSFSCSEDEEKVVSCDDRQDELEDFAQGCWHGGVTDHDCVNARVNSFEDKYPDCTFETPPVPNF